VRRPRLSPKATDKVADLDEKLRWGLITPRRYDQEYEKILLRDQQNPKETKLSLLFRRGKITKAEYESRLKTLRAKYETRLKRRCEVLSDRSLSSGFGKPSVFPHGERSDRRRGRTAYLAKKSR